MALVRARPVYEEDCEQLGAAADARENKNTKSHPSESKPTSKHIALALGGLSDFVKSGVMLEHAEDVHAAAGGENLS
jgi:hypothetical protein